MNRLSVFLAVLLGLAAPATASAGNAAAVERGRYLVESILACGNCHTPKSADGRPIDRLNLAGGGAVFTLPPFDGTSSNLTPDRETGIGRWSDADIKRALIDGVRPRQGRLANTHLGVVMPVSFFRALTPSDLDAVVAYLRTLPPIAHAVPPPTYREEQVHQRFPGAASPFANDRMNDPVYRGRYLVTIGHCMECHSPMDKGVIDYSRLGAGGRQFGPQLVQGFPASWTGSRAPNITSHPTAGIGRWSDAEIRAAIAQGISRDGRALKPPMPVSYYARLSEQDLSAIVAYLRTVPPLE